MGMRADSPPPPPTTYKEEIVEIRNGHMTNGGELADKKMMERWQRATFLSKTEINHQDFASRLSVVYFWLYDEAEMWRKNRQIICWFLKLSKVKMLRRKMLTKKLSGGERGGWGDNICNLVKLLNIIIMIIISFCNKTKYLCFENKLLERKWYGFKTAVLGFFVWLFFCFFVTFDANISYWQSLFSYYHQ